MKISESRSEKEAVENIFNGKIEIPYFCGLYKRNDHTPVP